MFARYELSIYQSKADESFGSEVTKLTGCMADATPYEEAVANAQTVGKEWIDTAKLLDGPIPEPKGRS